MEEFAHDFLFLRSADSDGKAHGGFQWPTVAGEMVTAPDWNPEPICGGGLHGLAEGVGDWGLLKTPSDSTALWYVCGAIRSEAVTVDDLKIKVPRCRVLYVGSFAGAMDLISPRMTDEVMRLTADRRRLSGDSGAASNSGDRGAASNSGDSGAASNSGDSGAASNSGDSGAASNSGGRGAASNSGYCGAASNSGDRGAASNSGEYGAASNSGGRGAASNSGDSGAASNSGYCGAASSVGKHGVALSHGFQSIGMVTDSNLLILVERCGETGAILHHFAAMCGTKNVKPNVWYMLTGGKLTEVNP